MEEHQIVILARAIHVMGVVLWIGGVGFVTTVLIPALRQVAEPDRRLALFEQLEGRFSIQAKGVTLITGLSGLYMLRAMNAWERYLRVDFWWMHLMVAVWVLFALMIYVLEPIVIHDLFHKFALEQKDRAFALATLFHAIALLVSGIAIGVGVLGAHGGFP